jgi:hypothetical protein
VFLFLPLIQKSFILQEQGTCLYFCLWYKRISYCRNRERVFIFAYDIKEFHIATTGNVFLFLHMIQKSFILRKQGTCFYFCLWYKRASVGQQSQWYCYKPCASCVYVNIWYIYHIWLQRNIIWKIRKQQSLSFQV